MNSTPPEEPRSKAERFDQWVRRSTPVLIVLLLLFLVTTVAAVGDQVSWIKGWYHDRYHWREDEYTKLLQLHSDMTLDRFEAVLGSPLFEKKVAEERWVEYTFVGRDHWVQAVTRPGSSTVTLYAVTSCSERFNPTFRLSDSTRIILNESRLASVRTDLFTHRMDYFLSGATANSYILESVYGGNPGNYKSFSWGYNDACGTRPAVPDIVHDALGLDGELHGAMLPASKTPNGIRELRERTIVNTFAEWGPTERLEEGVPFQIGVNRLLIRTILDPYYEPTPVPTDG